MPKRIVDGEGVWRSQKLKQVRQEFRAEYANLLPLAEANGVFEVDAGKVWADVYSYNRENITKEFVAEMLADYERVELLRIWKDGSKTWGYWEGIDKPGRLPSGKHLSRFKNLPPNPPDKPTGSVPDFPERPQYSLLVLVLVLVWVLVMVLALVLLRSQRRRQVMGMR